MGCVPPGGGVMWRLQWTVMVVPQAGDGVEVAPAAPSLAAVNHLIDLQAIGHSTRRCIHLHVATYRLSCAGQLHTSLALATPCMPPAAARALLLLQLMICVLLGW